MAQTRDPRRRGNNAVANADPKPDLAPARLVATETSKQV